MPTPDSHNPVIELMHATSKIDPGALVSLWANLPPHPPGFTGDLFERFDDIDLDGDGFISRKELDAACASRRFRSHQAAALATLRVLLSRLEGLNDDEFGCEDDGATRADLAGFDLKELHDPSNELVTEVKLWYQLAKKKIAASPRTVFDDDAQPSIDPMVCRQGMMGDCFFLAPLMSLAFQDPDRVLSMIRRHPELPDAWRIYFRGASEAITVMTPTDAEIALFASADGLWPIIFEKACGIHLRDEPYAMLTLAFDEMYGGVVEAALRLLTGSDIDVDELDVTRQSTTRAKLIEALGERKTVAAVTHLAKQGKEWTDDGLARSHAYSIISFDANSDMVYVRNPWGSTSGGLRGAEVSDGFFKMPLDTLDTSFWKLIYER